MARHRGPVLVDTNVILEGSRVGAWRALSGGYALETVEDCFTETQTGYQRRKPEMPIIAAELRKSLRQVHPVTDAQRAAIVLQAHDIALDAGELSLWAHALTRNDAWVLCGPDKASMRFGVRAGVKQRLIALETLLLDVGYRPKVALRPPYTTKWLEHLLAELSMSEGPRRT